MLPIRRYTIKPQCINLWMMASAFLVVAVQEDVAALGKDAVCS